MEKTTCDLCGLPLKQGRIVCKEFDEPLFFCCTGCRQVYLMLMAASNDPNPQTFQDTEIYKRCVAAGIIPKSTEDLQKQYADRKASQWLHNRNGNPEYSTPRATKYRE